MTYKEAIQLIEKHKNIKGQPLGDATVEYFIISTFNERKNVFSEFVGNGFNNEIGLKGLGLLDNEDLEVYVYPNKDIGVAAYADLKKYLINRGIEI